MGLFSRWFRKDSFYALYKEDYMIGKKGAVWLPTDKPYEMYELIPHLKIVIDRRADMFSNAEIILMNDAGERIEGAEAKEFNDFFSNPAPEYSQNEWLINYQAQMCIWGNQYMYAPFPSAMMRMPSFMRNLSPDAIQPYLSGKYFDQVKIEDMILYYQYEDNSFGTGTRKIETKDIIHSKIADKRFPLLGRSPILSLKLPASNTDAAYTNLNVISNNRGALGILTNNPPKDSMGGTKALKEGEADQIRKQVQRNHNKKRIIRDQEVDVIITNATLSWQAMSYPTKDLLLLEQISANGLLFCDAYGISSNTIFGQNTTYENVHHGLVQTYQNTIQPAADSFAQSLTRYLYKNRGIKDRKVMLSYEHVPALKIQKKESLDSIESLVKALNEAVFGKLLSPADATLILRNELTAIGSIDH